MAIFESKYRIGITDIGELNKLTNKATLKILEDAAGVHSEYIKFGINEINETKLSWIILNWKVKILSRPIYNSEVIIKTWVRDANRVLVYRDFEVYDTNGKLLIIATSKWALINIDTKSLALMPEEVIDAYKPEDKMVFGKRTIDKIKEPEQYSSKQKYEILRSDIDINEHVHNLYYLDIAYEALPKEIYYKEFNNIEILYKKQIKLGDDIECFYEKEKGKNVVAIKSEDGTILHSIVTLY